MSTTVSYKGSTIAAFTNTSKTLQTSGKWMEDDVTITDTSSSPSLQTKTNIHPSTSSQTISYDVGYDGLNSVQFNAVVLANLAASNIKSGVTVKVGDSTDDDCVASVTGSYAGGGGPGTLIKTVSLGTLTTSATSATDTGKTITLASTTGWSNYDLLLVDISVDSVTNGRHTSSVGFVFLTGTSNVNTKNTYAVGSNVWNSKVSSSGTKSTRQSSTKYGIYANSATVADGTLTLTVYYRYNSNHTGTINNAYTARVYGIKLIDLIGG